VDIFLEFSKAVLFLHTGMFHEQLLISGELLHRIGTLNGFTSRSIGKLQLKGKQHKIEVYAISEAIY